MGRANIINGSFTVFEQNLGRKTAGRYIFTVHREINIDTGNGGKQVGVTRDCQNSAIFHVVVLSPF